MSNQKWKGHVAVLFTSTIGAVNMPISKSLFDSGWIDGSGLTLWRSAVACVIFWMISPFFKSEKVSPKDLLILAGGAFFGMSFNQLSFSIGLTSTTTIDAAIISSLTPIFVLIMAAFLLKEPITGKKAIGVLIGMAGALLIVFSQGNNGGSSTFKGLALTTIAGISYALYLIINRSVVRKYSPMTISKWMFLFATILLIPFCFNNLIDSRLFTEPAPMSVYMQVAFTAIGASFLSYLLVPVSLKYIRPTTVSMYNYLQPLVASFIAISIGQDVLTWQKPVAGALIFLGVYFVTSSRAAGDPIPPKKNDQ